MKHADLKQIRQALGLSLADFAPIVGYEGDNAPDKLRAMEEGRKPVPGSLAALLRYLAQGVATEHHATEADAIAAVLPRFLDCADLENETSAVEIVLHTVYPRFYAVFSGPMDPATVGALILDGVPTLELPDDVGAGAMSILWIDNPGRRPTNAPAEALALKVAQMRADLVQ